MSNSPTVPASTERAAPAGKGKPARFRLRDVMHRRLAELARYREVDKPAVEHLVDVLIEEALVRRTKWAFAEIRAWAVPPRKVEVSGPDGGPIQHAHTVVDLVRLAEARGMALRGADGEVPEEKLVEAGRVIEPEAQETLVDYDAAQQLHDERASARAQAEEQVREHGTRPHRHPRARLAKASSEPDA